ncbi:MAG: Co/Zn/Cd efflux system component [Pseudohongiellaceae bacterium]|jgi:Co/Zn/Cd efflux system component
MVAEIITGSLFGSMALLADGWNMGTQVGPFLITIYAYRYASKHERNPVYTFGTGRVWLVLRLPYTLLCQLL